MNYNIHISMDSDKLPIFSIKKQACYREEKRGYASVIPQKQTVMNPLILNPTTVFILSLMNGKNTIKDIYESLIKKFGEKNKNSIETDLTRILYDLHKNNIIMWGKGGAPYMENFSKQLDGGYVLRLAFDNDLRNIVKFINSSSEDDTMVSYCNPLLGIDTKSDLVIRTALFSMLSCIFLLEQENHIVGLYSFDESQTTNTALVSNIICSPEHMSMMFKESVTLIQIGAVCVPKKLRLYLIQNTGKSDIIKRELTKELFASIAVLHKEVNDADVEMLDYELTGGLC